jgi:hypothetical protein
MTITWLVTKLTASMPQPSTTVDVTVELRTDRTAMDQPSDWTITNTFDSALPDWTAQALAWVTAKAQELGVRIKAADAAKAAVFTSQRALVGKSGTVDV